MSGSSGPSQPPGGVVRNSALSFVGAAPAHPGPAGSGESSDAREGQAERQVPAGLKALCDAYSKLYPDQPNPLQVTTKLKYWLGGHDPLDYISMYWNPGKPEENVPPHWHYVSFGLSDLHGDGRVHAPPAPTRGSPQASGCGVELTFRLAEPGAALWPALLLQALAGYLLTTGNKFCAGDHISWHAPLDGSSSRVRHLLVAEDPQLPPIDTVHGSVSFIQMVGCTGRELRAAQRGSGFDVLKFIADDPNSGAGSWLVTRARRRSARGVAARRGAAGAGATAPAHLAGVSARLRWIHLQSTEPQASPSLSPTVEQQIKETLQRGLSSMSTERTGPEGHTGMSTDSFEMSSIERALPQIPELMQGSWRGEDSIEYLDGVHLYLNAEGASLLPLAIHGRVLHGRHFTWRAGALAVTVLAPCVAGALPTPDHPYVCRGSWLQMLIPKDLAKDMSSKVSNLSKLAQSDSESDSEDEGTITAPSIPHTMEWPTYRLKISIVHDHELL